MSDKIPEQGSPDYDAETAPEAERWSFDQGYEKGYQEREQEAGGVPSARSELEELRDHVAAALALVNRLLGRLDKAVLSPQPLIPEGLHDSNSDGIWEQK